jgi:transcriptional antiterminator RfaH
MSIDQAGLLLPTARWVAINTHTNQERIALRNLERQAFEVYCPQINKQVRHARRVCDAQRPLFPGYLFVQITPGLTMWRPILSTVGVRALVRFGNELGTLDGNFIQRLKEREVDGAIVRPERAYQVGQQVRIAGGAFDNLVATIIDMDERDRLVVLMDLLNNKVRVKVEARGVVAL